MLEYLKSHPELVVAAVGALFTFFAKPRSPEEYEAIASFSPRVAAALKFMAAVFPDILKAFKALKEFKDGSYELRSKDGDK